MKTSIRFLSQKPAADSFIPPKVSIQYGEDSKSLWMASLPHAGKLAKRAIRQSAQFVKKAVRQPSHLTIFLTKDAEQRRLNKNYRGKNKSTNVLSFESQDLIDGLFHLGDLSLAIETIMAEAAQQNKSVSHHFDHLIVHGFLHLLGYDHQKDKEAVEMENIEIAILSKLNITNPYEWNNHA